MPMVTIGMIYLQLYLGTQGKEASQLYTVVQKGELVQTLN